MADPKEAVEEVLREFLDGSHEPYENLSGDQECATCWRLWPCSSRQLAAEIARLRTELAGISERTVGDVGDAITSAEGGMLWTDHAVNRIVANATRQSRADAERWQRARLLGADDVDDPPSAPVPVTSGTQPEETNHEH